MSERLRWEPMRGESARAFAAFELYRRLGPARTVEEAWRQYWGRPGARRSRASTSTAPRVMPYFSEWAVRWQWRERALAWDAEQAEIERDQRLDRELQQRAREHEEELRQRQLLREEARAARAVGRRVLLRALQGIEVGQLDQMSVPDLLPYLQKAVTLVEVGQKLERLYAEDPADAARQEALSPGTYARLLAVMQEFVPEERWGELAERLMGLDAAGPT